VVGVKVFLNILGVEIIQASKALHRLCRQHGSVHITRRGQINILLFIFRTSRKYKL